MPSFGVPLLPHHKPLLANPHLPMHDAHRCSQGGRFLSCRPSSPQRGSHAMVPGRGGVLNGCGACAQ
eukprot:8034515-Alexandrium_andersonii.AAC.1